MKKMVVSGFSESFLWLDMLAPEASFFNLRLVFGDVCRFVSVCFSFFAYLNR